MSRKNVPGFASQDSTPDPVPASPVPPSPDKYDRYLADVFLVGAADQKLRGESSALRDDIFPHNALLENGQAVRADQWKFGDWGFE